MSRCLFTLVLAATFAAGALLPAAEQPPPANANAALKYWTAFGLLPKLDKDQEKVLEDVATAPLDDTARKLADAAGPSLLYLHRGTALPQCDWALNMEDGVYLMLPQLSKARELAQLARLRARLHFAAGRSKEGIDDLLDTLALARRFGQEPTTMIAVLVEFAIERTALDTLAVALSKLSAADRADIAAGLRVFPPVGTVRDCLKSEKKHYLEWMIAKLRPMPADALKEELAKMFAPDDEANAVRELLKPLSNVEILRQLEAIGGVYDEFNRLAEQPRDQFTIGWGRLKERVTAQMPLAAKILPAVDKIVEAEDRQTAYRALFRAALAVADGGPDKLNDPAYRDPFGMGPFEHKARPQGFELRAALVLKFRNEPVVLVVGPK